VAAVVAAAVVAAVVVAAVCFLKVLNSIYTISLFWLHIHVVPVSSILGSLILPIKVHKLLF